VQRERERVRAEKIIINKQAREKKEEKKKKRKKGFILISSGLAMYGATSGKQQHTSITCNVSGDPDDDDEEEEDSSQQHQQWRRRRSFCCRCCCGGCRCCCRSSSSNYATNVSKCVIVPHHPRSCQILSHTHPPISSLFPPFISHHPHKIIVNSRNLSFVSRRKRKIRKKTARILEPAESVFGLFGVPLAKAPIRVPGD
jgi:hypothetical protein